jgi:hypothetical protein
MILYCANCGQWFEASKPGSYIHRSMCVTLCGIVCLEEMEYRYAALVLRQPTDRERAQQLISERGEHERTNERPGQVAARKGGQ